MVDLIIDTLASMYDAVIRGVCWAIALAVAFPVVIFVIKKTPRLLKTIGVW